MGDLKKRSLCGAALECTSELTLTPDADVSLGSISTTSSPRLYSRDSSGLPDTTDKDPENNDRMGSAQHQDVHKHPRVPSGSMPQNPRRRKYYAPRNAEDAQICGPLQSQVWGRFWRWRWCVVDQKAVHLYRDEQSWRAPSSKPLESFSLSRHVACKDLGMCCSSLRVFQVVDQRTGRTRVTLRTGSGERWEEIAAQKLWMHHINEAAEMGDMLDGDFLLRRAVTVA